MAYRRIHMEVLWVEGSTQSLLYITNAYWQNLKTPVLLDSVLVNFNWMCWASKERRNEKLKDQLENGRLTLLMSRTSLCLVPNTRCHFARKKKKKRNYKTSIFENLEDSCGPRIWQALVIVNVYAPGIAKCLQENLSTSDLQPVSNKEMSNAYGGIGFCKEKAKTFAQLLLHWDHGDE